MNNLSQADILKLFPPFSPPDEKSVTHIKYMSIRWLKNLRLVRLIIGGSYEENAFSALLAL